MTDWAAFTAELGDIPTISEPALVRQKSRDFFWYSPILKPLLNDKSAELVVCPRDEADVIRTASLCARYRVALTTRGGGTGNYGQAVPLQGGVVLDMMALNKVIALECGTLRVQAGAKLIDIEAETRPQGWELRMHPSTKRTATIGGFVAGGSGGIGSIIYGGLRDRGNVIAARVVSCEETPRIIELTGDQVNGVNHAYGTTGIITALTIGMAPAQPWMDTVAGFNTFMEAVTFARALGLSTGIATKLISVHAAPLPSFFRGMAAPEGKHLVLCIVSKASLVAWDDLLASNAGTEISRVSSLEAEADPAQTPIYEYTWNHTTLQVLRRDKSVTYLQCLYPADRQMALVEEMHLHFGEEVMQHLEFIRVGGHVTCSSLPVVRFSTPERLAEIVRFMEGRGIMIANPHFYTLEDGAGHKRIGEGQPALKARMDPHALLNPGKMRSYEGAA